MSSTVTGDSIADPPDWYWAEWRKTYAAESYIWWIDDQYAGTFSRLGSRYTFVRTFEKILLEE